MDMLAAIKGCDRDLPDNGTVAAGLPVPNAADDDLERRLAIALWGAAPRPRPRVRTVCSGR